MFYYTLPEHLTSSSVIRVGFFLLDLWFCGSLFSSCPYLTVVLSVLLRFTDSDYPFGIFKLFSWLVRSPSWIGWPATEYLCHIWPPMCFAYRNRNPLHHSSYMTLHRTVNKCNTTDVTSGSGTANPSDVPEMIDFSLCSV